MNIKSELMKPYSWENSLKLVDHMVKRPDQLKILISLLYDDNSRLSHKAANIVKLTAEKNPSLLSPYIGQFANMLESTVPDALKRDALRILQFTPIPVRLQGKIAEACFGFLSSTAPVAIKAFSLSVLSGIAKQEPSISRELQIIIETQIVFASPAFVSRAKKVLHQLKHYRRNITD
jgi:hypothetical protein